MFLADPVSEAGRQLRLPVQLIEDPAADQDPAQDPDPAEDFNPGDMDAGDQVPEL